MSPRRHSLMNQCLCVAAILLVCLVPAHGQTFEITPLVGGILGGTMRVEQPEVSPRVGANLNGSFAFGIAGGVRFNPLQDLDEEPCKGCDSVDFRWLRQHTHLSVEQNPFVPTPVIPLIPDFRPAVTIDRFLADFTHEWNLKETRKVKPFLTASLGAARISVPASSVTKFMFGIGAGVVVLPKPHWGFLFRAEYLPIVREAQVQRLVCVAGACVFAFGGGLINQVELTAGPTFRF
ncbi:MAG TPA: hypothetical protein VH640_02970 [Bryobacteraceae bacterium]